MKFCDHTQWTYSWIKLTTICFLSYYPVHLMKETVILWNIVVLDVHMHDVQKKGLK